ncbi:C-type mannose receptor 2-like [Poecilia formosa]|uniref:C-type mannose receptor 2-like n=1 Tax=Poecilia formosa TaxID=48698 RepID=UPI0007BAC39D|nr:PREDICTED: C-type mannose receptor 2-like [Poecilia formosa]
MKEAWIGLYNQTEGDRRQYWSLPGVEFDDNETIWNPGEPNVCGKRENCGLLVNTSTWGYASCSIQRYFLCYNDTNTTHKYHLIKEKKSWQEAQSYCREKHTDLISGTKQLQDEEVEKVMKSTHRKPFIGLFRDTWRWSDGSNFSFRHWNKNFKNVEHNRDQCVMAVPRDKGRWKNESCNDKKPFICYDDKVILIKENKTWEDALTYCRDHHHDLVTITNMEDQRWIQEKVKNASTDYVWIGLHYAWSLHFWFWVSDEVVSYENWASCPKMDDCDVSGAMETRGGHKWLEKKDSETFNFICSKY